jgi:hypothetical protein
VIGAVIGLLSASPDSVGTMVAGQLNGGAFGALLGGLISLAANPIGDSMTGRFSTDPPSLRARVGTGAMLAAVIGVFCALPYGVGAIVAAALIGAIVGTFCASVGRARCSSFSQVSTPGAWRTAVSDPPVPFRFFQLSFGFARTSADRRRVACRAQ